MHVLSKLYISFTNAGKNNENTTNIHLFQVTEIDSADTSGAVPNNCEGTVSFENVEFVYPTRTDVPVSLILLRDVFFFNQKLAIVHCVPVHCFT